MSALAPIEVAAEKMRILVESDLIKKLTNANEAETRLLIVDEILGILGWHREEYRPELPTSTRGYTDYRLSLDGVPLLIVEAKRLGRIAPFPSSIQRPQYSNTFLYNSCGQEMQLLLQQCRDYCGDCGLPYAIATTGDIWVVLVGFKFGVEWGKLRSLVFHSLGDIYERFGEFYGLISRESVKQNSLEDKFQSMILIKPGIAIRPRSQVENVPDVGEIPDRNVIEAYLDRYMGDIIRTDEGEMLKQCYVDNRTLNEFSHDLQQILSYDAALDGQDFPIDEIDTDELHKAIDFQMRADNPRTILLVGNIGAGKSTFLHRFLRFEAMPKKNVCVVIDLINESNLNIIDDRAEQQSLSKLVLDRLAKEFQVNMDPFDPTILRRSFEPEITKYRKLFARLASVNSAQYELQEEAHIASLTENKYLQLSGYIRQAKKKGYRTWIAFDNVDRGSASYQKFVYSFAHQLATSAGCVTLITLREDTFLEAKAAGFLDVRTSDRVFQLVAPELKQVISRRRKYVERSIERNEVPAIFKQHTNTIARLNAHISLLFLQNDESLRLLLTSFSLRNIRYGLDLIRSYYMSYHSTFHTSRLLQEEGTSKGVSRFSGDAEELERFIQSLMLGNSWAYQEGSSEVFNIFAVDPLEQTSHFLLLRILAYLRIDHNMSSRPTVRYERLLSDFVWLGYQRHHINGAITRLISNGLLVSPNLRTISHIEMLDMSYAEIKIAISAKGVYYLERLAGNSYYQLRVAEDTIWYDEELAKIYIKSLQDWAVSQGRDDAQDLLQATNARETFLLYLRRSLLNEYRDSNQRRSSRQWAIIVDDMVETRIFGEKVSQSVYLSESDVTGTGEVLPSNTSKSPRKSGREHMKSLLAQPAETGYLQSELQFPGVAEASATDLMRESLKRLGQLPRGAKVGKSQYPVKVLWALELASFAGLMQLRASEISQIINSFGSGTVEATNVARFLRQQRLIGEYSHLWSEPSPGFFSINSTGQDVLKAIMKKEKRTKSSPKKRNN